GIAAMLDKPVGVQVVKYIAIAEPAKNDSFFATPTVRHPEVLNRPRKIGLDEISIIVPFVFWPRWKTIHFVDFAPPYAEFDQFARRFTVVIDVEAECWKGFNKTSTFGPQCFANWLSTPVQISTLNPSTVLQLAAIDLPEPPRQQSNYASGDGRYAGETPI